MVGDDDEPPPPAEPPADQLTDPEQIRKRIVDAEHFVNQHASRLPAAAVVKARWLTDTLREILDTSATRPLDIHAVLLVRNTVEDFLPTTLRSYLTLEASMRDRPAPVPELLPSSTCCRRPRQTSWSPCAARTVTPSPPRATSCAPSSPAPTWTCHERPGAQREATA